MKSEAIISEDVGGDRYKEEGGDRYKEEGGDRYKEEGGDRYKLIHMSRNRFWI